MSLNRMVKIGPGTSKQIGSKECDSTEIMIKSGRRRRILILEERVT